MVPPEITPAALVGWDKAEFSSEIIQSPVLVDIWTQKFISCLFRLQEVLLLVKRDHFLKTLWGLFAAWKGAAVSNSYKAILFRL